MVCVGRSVSTGVTDSAENWEAAAAEDYLDQAARLIPEADRAKWVSSLLHSRPPALCRGASRGPSEGEFGRARIQGAELPLGLEVAALQGLISDNYVALAEFGGIELFLRRSRKAAEFLNGAEKFFLEVDSERDLLWLSFEYRLLLLDESSLIRLASASRWGAGEEVEDRLLEGLVRVRQAARRDAWRGRQPCESGAFVP